MSRGTPVKTLRVPQAIVDRVQAAIDSANDRRFAQPYDWTAWALKAIAEKLAHLERSRNRRRKPRRIRGRPTSSAASAATQVMGAAHLPPSLV
jgi:hypothetical protein